MRRALFIMAGVILASTAVYSMDLNPGTISLSGMTGLNLTSETLSIEGMDDLENDYLSFEVNGEYFILKNVGIGVFLTYESTKEDIPGSDDRYECTARMLGPMVVYNLSVAEKASVPLFASFGQAAYDQDGEDLSGSVWSVGGGVHYFVTNQVSLDGYLVYVSASLKDGYEMDMTQLRGRVGFSVYLGGK